MIQKQIRSAGILIFRRDKNKIEYLLLKHSAKGNHWGPPKGKLNPGESKMDAAFREVKEEAGLTLINCSNFKCVDEYKFIKKDNEYSKKVFYFLGEVKNPKIVLSPEHLNYSWNSIEEAIKKLNGQSLISVYNRAHRFLSKKIKNKRKLIFASYPKCGRTWVTMILGRIIQKRYGFSENEVLCLEKMSSEIMDLPKISVTHEDDPHLKTADNLSRDKSKYSKDSVILLVRDPRDVIVSFYFHESKRKERYNGSLSEFLFEKKGGFDNIINYFNIWAENKEIIPSFLLVRYEDVMKDGFKEISRILKFMDIGNILPEDILEALEFSSFANMQKMEKENRFGLNRLSPGNIDNLDTYKTRRGVVGGYGDYLTPKEVSALNKKMKDLSSYFGYI
ncbi:hypothetical protein AUJ84_01590 [Candidatus Pacearchaeota archaeon CG1_02_32_132]|nr:MAG: hypothetical protein AUJ84_01590 [Candidatus Pacearchaeota archaeon CG1_02_32_132]